MREVDIVIIGGGPAGMAALASCQEVGFDAYLFEARPELGGQLLEMYHAVVDYPGCYNLSGREIRDKFLESIPLDRVSLNSGAAQASDNVYLFKGEKIRPRFVINATGAFQKRLSFPGAPRAIYGDLPFEDYAKYLRKNVTVVGGGDSAIETALKLAEAGANVTIVNRSNRFKARPAWFKNAAECSNIKIYMHSNVVNFEGDLVKINFDNACIINHPCDELFIRAGVDVHVEHSWLTKFDIGDAANPDSKTIANAVAGAIKLVKTLAHEPIRNHAK